MPRRRCPTSAGRVAPPQDGSAVSPLATLSATAAGDALLVRIALENPGAGPRTDVRVRAALPAGTRVTDTRQHEIGRGAVLLDGHGLTWSDITLGRGERAAPLTVLLQPAPGVDGADIFRHAALHPELTVGGQPVPVPTLRVNGLWGADGLRRTALPSLLTVFTHERPGTGTVSVRVAVRAGSRDEDDATRGGSHWLEHAHLLGTPTRPDNQAIFDVTGAVGGSTNATTSFEWTDYFNLVPAEHLALAVDVLADQLLNSTFPREAFDRERRVVAEEIRRAIDAPAAVAIRELFQTVFQASPLRRDVLGSVESVAEIPIATMLAYREQRYVTGNMAVAVAGNLRHDEAVDLVARAFAPLRAAPRTDRPHTPEPAQTDPRRRESGRGGAISEIRIGWPAPGDDDDHAAPALAVLQDILGGVGRRLAGEVVDRLGLASAAGAVYADFSDAGAFLLSVGTSPAGERRGIDAAFVQMRRVRDGAISDDDVTRAINARIARRALAEESNAAQTRRANQEVAGHLESFDEYLARLRPVRATDVIEVARAWLNPDTASLVVARA
ncbi:MAG: pitrilysin family protein [Dehalococcoidia bacterium]